jgi:hypothetical protein
VPRLRLAARARPRPARYAVKVTEARDADVHPLTWSTRRIHMSSAAIAAATETR